MTGESDTQNNCSTGVEITVVEGDPELSVSLTRLSDNILGTGVSFTLAATVRNYGEGDAGLHHPALLPLHRLVHLHQ